MYGLLSETTGLLAFCRTVETGSFTAASRSIGTSPSSASKAVSRLEAVLGAKLFRRTTRTLTLTQEGEALFERMRPILDLIEQAGDVVQFNQNTSGHLRVSLPGEFGRQLLGPIFEKFMVVHPGISLQLDMTDRHADVVRDGYDAAYRVGFAEQNSLISRTLAQLDMAVVASPSFEATRGKPVTAEMLRELPFARYSIGGRTYPVQLADGTEFIPKGRLDLDTAAAIHQAARSGIGLAYVIKLIVQEDLARGTLFEVIPSASLKRMPFQVLHALGRMPTHRLQVFTEFVAETVRALQEGDLKFDPLQPLPA
ncbi:LysR family transcriptional regulator [Rhizobium sp. 11515TR]|uniref:LysR family transcriptional regulator n=1 Tax=Rhizobium sp. 11515TR TaxID=2028343 RepID=UPI000BA866D9|nr:LysR family transcriptional regulator [Rhizobium sp. 11515TR]ASW08595.1 LysR family transcriptional regulator [Rhizobium sp. 11515TR]